MQLEYIERYSQKNSQKADLAIIWLHGLGADCNDFVPLIPQLDLGKNVKFIFPNAPMIPITINNGYVMRGWYDIRSLNKLSDAVDYEGITHSVNAINKLIEAQINLGFREEQIFLAGFSQGGVISLTTGLMSKYKLGGVIGLSCYLADVNTLVKDYGQNKQLPIFMAHGIHDPIVPFIIGKNTYLGLKNLGFNIVWHEYQMEHSVCMEEIQEITKFLQNI